MCRWQRRRQRLFPSGLFLYIFFFCFSHSPWRKTSDAWCQCVACRLSLCLAPDGLPPCRNGGASEVQIDARREEKNGGKNSRERWLPCVALAFSREASSLCTSTAIGTATNRHTQRDAPLCTTDEAVARQAVPVEPGGRRCRSAAGLRRLITIIATC